MTISETMAVALVVTGGLSLYLVVHAIFDLYRHCPPENEEQ